MDLSNLKPPVGSRHKIKRVGRGESSGLGKTSGRGHKGQKSRAGRRLKRGFEGGQNPLIRRMPKFGFTKPNRAKREVITLTDLNVFADGTTIDMEFLKSKKIISSKFEGRVKLLATGKLQKKLTVKLSYLSAGAKKAIESAGGSIVVATPSGRTGKGKVAKESK